IRLSDNLPTVVDALGDADHTARERTEVGDAVGRPMQAMFRDVEHNPRTITERPPPGTWVALRDSGARRTVVDAIDIALAAVGNNWKSKITTIFPLRRLYVIVSIWQQPPLTP